MAHLFPGEDELEIGGSWDGGSVQELFAFVGCGQVEAFGRV